MLVAADPYRPAAVTSSRRSASSSTSRSTASRTGTSVLDIGRGAVSAARSRRSTCVIIDTAGRTVIDEPLMDEIRELAEALQSVGGAARRRRDGRPGLGQGRRGVPRAAPVTGLVLTKIDGDARGGAALSIRAVTGLPIKFLGTGESTDALEPFHPDRLAGRILGMGDVMTLIERAQENVDQEEAEELAGKLQRNRSRSRTSWTRCSSSRRWARSISCWR